MSTDRSEIVPVLLCGGSGTRLWPLSRKSYPKQFSRLLEGGSLFQASASRFNYAGFAQPVVVTASDFRFVVAEQLVDIGVTPETLVIEPEAKNTAPAVLAAAMLIAETAPEALLLIAPADHVVPDAETFRDAVAAARPAAEAGKIATFGIAPTRAETGYGWLELEGAPKDGAPIPLKQFVEKPNAETAARMLEAGNYLWNAGIFLARANALISAFEQHAPALIEPVRQAVMDATPDLGFLRLAAEPWSEAESNSIDYAVMEKADNLAVVPFTGAWSDLGGWDAVWRASPRDERGVSLGPGGRATAIDCDDTLLRSETAGQEIVGLGLKNVMAVAMGDAVLVADMSRAQDVRQAVDALKVKKASQATEFPRDYRPWGWFETLILRDRFQVKRIVVKPGGILSLQSHVHRAEHWIVVEGTARVTIGDDVKLVSENQSVYIPLGERHRMENPGKLPMVLIEVQTGSYLGEDDITRYEDLYARDQS